MPKEDRAEEELRCVCRWRTLLALVGRDADTTEPYVWVKAFKSVGRSQPPRIFAEVVVTSGVVRLRCRDCHRWHKITISPAEVAINTENIPATISV